MASNCDNGIMFACGHTPRMSMFCLSVCVCDVQKLIPLMLLVVCG